MKRRDFIALAIIVLLFGAAFTCGYFTGYELRGMHIINERASYVIY